MLERFVERDTNRDLSGTGVRSTALGGGLGASVPAIGEAAPLDEFAVSPAALFGAIASGETTGAYRIGGDIVVIEDDEPSEIFGADFALAFVDEIETQAHRRQRFTVGH